MRVDLSNSLAVASAAAFWLAAIAVSGCERSTMQPMDTRETLRLSSDAVERLGRARVFFAHQSVGEDVLAGIRRLSASDQRLPLRIVEAPAEPRDSGGFFAHARLGQNGNPQSKTDAFVAALEAGLGDRVDIAFQKYCFADIAANTDVERVFSYYRDALAGLHQRYPHLRLAHVTTPLTVPQSGVKAAVKMLLGRMPDHYADNFARERFNNLLRREYASDSSLFDLAAIESRPEGSPPIVIQFGGTRGLGLAAAYSTDGGHLNEAGQARVATELLAFIARTVDTAPEIASAAAGR